MPPITVRLSDKEKKSLEKYGKISNVVRMPYRCILTKRKRKRTLKKLEELQKENRLEMDINEVVASIRKDRASD